MDAFPDVPSFTCSQDSPRDPWTRYRRKSRVTKEPRQPAHPDLTCLQGGARLEQRDQCNGALTLGWYLADCGKDRAPIQGLGIRWGFSRYEAQQMSDPQFNALAGQVQAISAQIQTEQSARVAADEILASRVTAGEAAIAAVRLQLVADAGNESGEKILLERRLIEIERRLGIV